MPHRRLFVAFGLLLSILVLTSRPQRVGDGREYVAMAVNMAEWRLPALADADRQQVSDRMDGWGFTGLPLEFPQLRQGGRQDFFHFWVYSALAVPAIWLTSIAGLHPNYAFAGVNLLLFLTALWIVSTRLTWWPTLLVFCSPAIWWIDKSHTELFTFSLLAIAFSLLREAPWWSAICLGTAATQNPPIAVPLGCVVAMAPFIHPGAWRDVRYWAGATVGTSIALIHPIYYGWRWGVATPQLLQGTHARVPTVQEFGAVLWDLNIGLLWHAPVLTLAVAAAIVWVAVRIRSRPVGPEVWLALGTAGVFLAAFAQTTNVNNGATPGMSRYALWLIPLAIPIFQRVEPLVPSGTRRWLVPLALAGCVWSLIAFHPARAERYHSPTRLANLVWTRFPALDNPYPEIFAERMSNSEPGLLPVATPECAKVLLLEGDWPVPCAPHTVPPRCRMPLALCYANRNGVGYDFVRAPAPAGSYVAEAQRSWAWNVSTRSRVEKILARVRWRDMHRTSHGVPGAMIRAAHEVAWAYGLQSGEELLVYVKEPRPGASLTLRLPGTMRGALFDPATGDESLPIRIDSQPWALTRLDLPAGRATVLALTWIR